MQRRNVITLLGGVSFAGWDAAHAQQVAVPRVGCLTVAPLRSPVAQQLVGALRDGLRGLGYVEGRTIAFEYRSADGEIERLRDLAADLVRLKVDLIATFSNDPRRSACDHHHPDRLVQSW